ncbi:MAG: hypothetical protein JSU81_09640 [Candidatus Coatesbacteria bacterium]|nr:MAG: hypothetical protein JSU81_09640 [Candidatus Coatesbacteria bacterium]
MITKANRQLIAAVVVLTAGFGTSCGPGERAEEEPAATGAPEEAAMGTVVVVGPDQRLLPAGVAVFDPGEHGKPRWEGLAGDAYSLPAGTYDVLLEYFGQRYWRRGVDLAGGEWVVALPMATLAVEARSSRGDRLAGKVAAFSAGKSGGLPAMEGETSEDLALLAGTYDVRVTVQGREQWLRGVELQAGDAETQTVVEPVGYLRVEVVDQDGEPLSAEVWVYGSGARHEPLALGKSDRPLALLPGRYDVAVRWAERREYSAGLTVLANQTTVERFTFWRGETS